jgi:hypothetical protein
MTEQTPAYVPQPAPLAKPPLSPELKRKASVAGAVSFTVMSIGWGLLSTAVMIGLFSAFFAWVVGVAGASREVRDADFLRLMDFIESINPAAWVVPLVIAGVVGAALWVWSVFISRGMLARAGHPNPWGVTWAGAGVAIAASWFVGWVAWIPLQLSGAVIPDGSFETAVAVMAVFGVVSLLLSLVVTVVIGWFAWWWMAHLMRPAASTV